MVDNAICYNASITDANWCNFNSTVAGVYILPAEVGWIKIYTPLSFFLSLSLSLSLSHTGWQGHWREYEYSDMWLPPHRIYAALCIYPALQTSTACEEHGLTYEVHIPMPSVSACSSDPKFFLKKKQ